MQFMIVDSFDESDEINARDRNSKISKCFEYGCLAAF